MAKEADLAICGPPPERDLNQGPDLCKSRSTMAKLGRMTGTMRSGATSSSTRHRDCEAHASFTQQMAAILSTLYGGYIMDFPRIFVAV